MAASTLPVASRVGTSSSNTAPRPTISEAINSERNAFTLALVMSTIREVIAINARRMSFQS